MSSDFNDSNGRGRSGKGALAARIDNLETQVSAIIEVLTKIGNKIEQMAQAEAKAAYDATSADITIKENEDE